MIRYSINEDTLRVHDNETGGPISLRQEVERLNESETLRRRTMDLAAAIDGLGEELAAMRREIGNLYQSDAS